MINKSYFYKCFVTILVITLCSITAIYGSFTDETVKVKKVNTSDALDIMDTMESDMKMAKILFDDEEKNI